jgi:predicted RNA-binding Zn ribbon-like protein
VTPKVLVTLANLGWPRRPAHAAKQVTEPALADAAIAAARLGSLIDRPVTETDLAALREVQQAAVQAADSLLAGDSLDVATLNRLASGSVAHVELSAADGTVHRHLVWDDPSVAAGLARALIEELATLDPSRLRRCARAGCGLLFYDTTRSRTRRWHAEDPCGWRERQQHRRAEH